MKKRLSIPKDKVITGPALIWKRILAFVIDYLIFDFVVITFFSMRIKEILPLNISPMEMYSYLLTHQEILMKIAQVFFPITLLALIYFTYQEYKFKDTIGKRLVKIYVKSDQQELKLWQCVVRNIYWVPLVPIFPLLAIVDFISMFFTKENQRLSELISKTHTVSNYSLSYEQ